MSSIQELIDTKLAKKNEGEFEKRNTGKYHPSSLGRCYRMQYWQRKGEKPSNPPDARTLRVFQAGHLFHDFIQQYLPKHEVEVVCEAKNIKGSADIVTDDTVIDIKSQHSRAFWWMKKKGADIRKEKYNNWLQVACYAFILDKPKLRLVFISKDDLCITEYNDTLANWSEELTKEVRTLDGIWEEDVLPAATPRCYNGKECDYCNFKSKCKEKEDESKSN